MRICVNPECPDVIAGYAEYADATETCARCGGALEAAPEKPDEDHTGALVTIFRGPELGQVRYLADLLRSAELTVYVYGQHEALTGGGYSMMDQWRTASIQVPEDQGEQARKLLADAEATKEFSEEAPEGEGEGRETAQRLAAEVAVPRVGVPFLLTIFVGLPILLGLQHLLAFSQTVVLAGLVVFGLAAFFLGSRFPALVPHHSCGNCGKAVGPTQGFCDGCDRKLVVVAET